MRSLAESGMTMVCVTHEIGVAREVTETTANEFFYNLKEERLQKFFSQIVH